GQPWDGFPRGSAQVDFDQDLTLYARTDTQGACEVRRVADDQLLYQLPAGAEPGSLGAVWPFLSRDGRFLILRRQDLVADVWRLEEGNARPLLEEKDVSWAEFHPDGRQVALAQDNGDVSLHDLEPAEVPARRGQRRLSTGLAVPTLALHPSEPLVAVTSTT